MGGDDSQMRLEAMSDRNRPLQAELPMPHCTSTAPYVAIFLQDLAGGGAERMMLQLAGGMADCGVKVDLVLVRAIGPYLSAIPPKVHVVNLGTSRTLHSIPALVRYLRRARPS